MANDKCDKCNHKLTKKELVSKQNSCSRCAKDSGVQTDHRTLVSEILLYANHHRKTSTNDNLATALAVYFDLDEVKEARDLIWAEFEDDNILDEDKRSLLYCYSPLLSTQRDDPLRGCGSLDPSHAINLYIL